MWIDQVRSEIFKRSGVMKENLSGIKRLLAVTDDPGAWWYRDVRPE